MCWYEKDHEHTCPWCLKDFAAQGSDEEYEAIHSSIEKCPHCEKPLKWDEDGGDPEKGEEDAQQL